MGGTFSHAPAALREFFSNLATWLSSAGVTLDAQAFEPHVTLVRKANCGELSELMAPIVWPVDKFALVKSVRATPGPRYETLRVWAAH